MSRRARPLAQGDLLRDLAGNEDPPPDTPPARKEPQAQPELQPESQSQSQSQGKPGPAPESQDPLGTRPRILVIKLGALGDIVQAAGPFAAIRRHHADAHITLLTTRPFVSLLENSPWFDEIWVDERPKMWQFVRLAGFRARMRQAGFARVYDLQTSDRSGLYFRLLPAGTEWSGIVQGASFRHDSPERIYQHTIERQRDQLAGAGLHDVPFADLSWVHADISAFGLGSGRSGGRDYALLVPGGSRHRPEKRWPADKYIALAWKLMERGVTPVIIGGPDEQLLGAQMTEASTSFVNLCGHTNYSQIVELARGCAYAVGNDTGPIHLISVAGAKVVVLFSGASDPALCAPRGPASAPPVKILRREPLVGLSVNEVEAALGLR